MRFRVSRFLLAGALAGGLVLTAGPAVADDHLADLNSTTADGVTTVAMDAVQTDASYLTADGKELSGEESEQREPEAGDKFIRWEDLTQDGQLVGTDKTTCTITDPDKFDLRCEVTLTFADGTVTARAELTRTDEPEGDPFDLSVTGGSGAYAGITGTLTVRELEGERQDFTLTYSLDGDSQVEAVPTGGADTGGALPDTGTNLALFGLSAAVLAAGAALVGAGRLAGRRR